MMRYLSGQVLLRIGHPLRFDLSLSHQSWKHFTHQVEIFLPWFRYETVALIHAGPCNMMNVVIFGPDRDEFHVSTDTTRQQLLAPKGDQMRLAKGLKDGILKTNWKVNLMVIKWWNLGFHVFFSKLWFIGIQMWVASGSQTWFAGKKRHHLVPRFSHWDQPAMFDGQILNQQKCAGRKMGTIVEMILFRVFKPLKGIQPNHRV